LRELARFTASSRRESRMLSYSLSYSVTIKGRPQSAQAASELVGVAGFEPAASSSRTGSAEIRMACSQESVQSATSTRLGRPHLSAPDGRSPLPFRSQNRTPVRCAVCRLVSWSPAATTCLPAMSAGSRQPVSDLCRRARDGCWRAAPMRVNETQAGPSLQRAACSLNPQPWGGR